MTSLQQLKIIWPLLLLLVRSLDAYIFDVSDSDIKKYSSILIRPEEIKEIFNNVLENIPTNPSTDPNDMMCSPYSTTTDTSTEIPKDVKVKNEKVINTLNSISAVLEKLSPAMNSTDGNETLYSLFSPAIQHYFRLIDNLYKKSVHLRKYNINDDLGTSMKLMADYSQSVTKEFRYIKYLLQVINLTIMNCTSPVSRFNENYFNILIKNGTSNNTKYTKIQMYYYRLLILMMHEIKGFTVMAHGYSINPTFGSETAFDVKTMTEEILGRMESYIQATNTSMTKLTNSESIIRASHPSQWIRGETYMELEHFQQYQFVTAEEVATKKCSNTTESADCIIDMRCTSYKQLELCYAVPNAVRNLYWYKDEKGNHYGKYFNHEACYKKTTHGLPSMSEVFMCHGQKTHKINVALQEVNIDKNYIVTGVKIVRENETLSVQIEQGVLGPLGTVQPASWKPLEYGEPAYLSNLINGLELQSVKVPSGYLVTGVGFKKWMDDSYILAVRGTKYDFLTGELNFTDSKYYPDPPLVNKHERAPYVNSSDGAGDLPFDADAPEPIEDTWIQFHTSGEEQDAGQTTFPLLDIQPVRASSPLKGVSLVYKRTISYGGFIAPKIYTNVISFEPDP